MKFAGEMLTRNMESIQLIILFVIAIVSQSVQQIQFPQDQKPFNATAVAEKRRNHDMLPVSESKLWHVTNDLTDKGDFDVILDNILIRRVSGTPENVQVRNYIVNRMQQLGWQIQLDQFDDNTPFGVVNFANVIATHNPNAERYLILACHYDSKHFKEFVFVGAIDSAVPCAIMINVAKTLQQLLSQHSNNVASDIGLMFLFLDGEEAFVQWTNTDSIYGARHLAAKWEKEGVLSQIDLFVLLDLLGTPNPRFYSYFENTDKIYEKLSGIEKRLSKAGVLEKYSYSSANNVDQNELYFQPYSFRAGIDDDHVPFMQRNVPILHLIPSPFPEVWHKDIDDRNAIDAQTVQNLIKILRVFVLEYLNIPVD